MLAVVTGGTRGIGLAVVRSLLKLNYDCIAVSRTNAVGIDALVGEYGDKVGFVKCDISEAADRSRLFAFLSEKTDGVDLLVNCAGVAPAVRKDMLEIDVDDFDYVLNVNQKGTFFITQGVAKIMAKRKKGRIINISSVSSYAASVNRAEYCISKASVSMMTKLYAARLAEYGIGVFEVSPGIIETEMTACVKDKYAERIKNGLTLTDRLGRPSDVAKCVEAIADGKLDFCTGTVIAADGGFSVRRL